MRAWHGLVVVSFLLGCRTSLPRGQFGPYHRTTKQMHLANGDSLPVYRVSYWTFTDGSPPALQLEYEPPFSVDDRGAVREQARQVWPFFAPYVEARGAHVAIVTATNLRWKGWWPVVWSTRMHHFGIILKKDDKGAWWAEGDTLVYPAADRSGIPRITEADGSPLPFIAAVPERARV